MAVCVVPVAQRSTIRARNARLWAVVGRQAYWLERGAFRRTQNTSGYGGGRVARGGLQLVRHVRM